MSSTTAPNPSKDTYLSGVTAQRNTNFSTNTRLYLGASYKTGVWTYYNSVLEFDVSGVTDPAAIVSANLDLTFLTAGLSSVVNTITVARLNQDFVEAEATYNEASSGVAWTGGVGALSNAELTEPVSTFEVGAGKTDDVSVDIKALLIDAIVRRGGVLRLVLGVQDASPSIGMGLTQYASSRHATERIPQIEIVHADRVVWDGSALDGVASTASNWVGDVAPTTEDYALFNDGAIDVTSGIIACHSLFISEGYTGEMIQSNGSAISIGSGIGDTGHKAVINKKRGKFYLKDLTDYDRTVFISNTPPEECKYENTAASWRAIVSNTGGRLELVGDCNLVASRAKKSATAITLSGTPTTVKANRCKLRMDNGCNDFILVDATKCLCTSGIIAQNGVSYITSKSVMIHRGTETGNDINIFRGRLTFRGNENSSIHTEDIMLWKNGIFDTRTKAGAWNDTATPSIEIRGGGNFLYDAGLSVAIA